MISRIAAHRYRCFSNLDIALPAYSVFAGANGTGKSTLLDIPLFIGDILTDGLQQAMLGRPRQHQPPRAQAPRDLLYRGHGETAALLLEARLPPGIAEQLKSVAPQRL